METYQLKLKAFEKALFTLKEALSLPASDIVRDATIQRFEYCFELCWKTLSIYLREIHGINCRSPKSCFREGLTVDIYDAQTTEIFLQMVDDRNTTTHIYEESLADEIFQNIKNRYYKNMENLLERLKIIED